MSKDETLDTRHTIVQAAVESLRAGEASFSMGQIARRAGLSRQALYLHFRDRGALLVAAVDALNEEVGILRIIERVRTASCARAALEQLVDGFVAQARATLPAMLAVRELLESDDDVRQNWEARSQGRASLTREVVRRLRREGEIPRHPALMDQVTVVQAVTSVDAVRHLTENAGWSRRRVSSILTRAVRGALSH